MEQLPTMNLAELKKTISDGKYMLFFSADWCPDCSFIKPAMPEIEAEYPDYKFIAVDRDQNIDLAADLAIFGIPSFVAFENGEEIGRYVNKDRKTKKQVEEFIDSL
ncbi:Thioredoxin-like protein YtpP [Apilactobacillus kunkeei]|uniref:thioredoxin family protein n=1 Tax=Apilactobacillus kunkeei TaxID=148814 RepID=UPI00200A4FF3|nr:thioredoxin family protein [Apilactobacillus kunkeei]MCK8634143.1 thioredoxin family protein [Apilactobacillus kunkeei]CAI2589550.1 Thioredoxin-like protein YtpP [Apilactobacillus kunkeei]CAI2589863.1 Thioredoxin-like protein YtpP [Apilactobacillus kunkeei]CAI2590107.1 Thioredoxin-like protein YtpP [Apilactobacillus kunkeei]CAI2590394.1 Thioredoxin-like protein YtpP [Apilactobacillus kunkeei]